MSDLAKEVQAWLKPRAEARAELVAQLVAVNTENPPGRNLGRCARLLADAMDRLGLGPELIELLPSRQLEQPCVACAGVGVGPGVVYFHGHFDVVPAQSPSIFAQRVAR